MEAAAVLRVAELRGARAACLLAVTHVPGRGASVRVDGERFDALGVRLGETGWAALRDAP